uniref:Uncharacterized protein n=2 Tax=Oryza TaxID=4527 RepID=Q6ZKD1_ORYSJ|nr:hypothetical protein [Oryza sativa Japonica Group]
MAPRPRLAPAHDRTLGSQPQPPTAHTRRTKVTNRSTAVKANHEPHTQASEE